MSKLSIKDITGKSIEVTDLDAAIRQCREGMGGRFKYEGTELTQNDNSVFMLAQLTDLLFEKRFAGLPKDMRVKIRKGEHRLSKADLATAIGLMKPRHHASLYPDQYPRYLMVELFNYYYGMTIE